jgi:hypothetical protein
MTVFTGQTFTIGHLRQVMAMAMGQSFMAGTSVREHLKTDRREFAWPI